MLFTEPSYDNFNGCRMYACKSEFRKSGECYFHSMLCKEREAHSETREDLEHWKTEYEIVVARLRGERHPHDNGIIAPDEIIPKLTCERDELQKAVNGLCEHFEVSPANTTLLAVELLKIERELDEARKHLKDIEEYGTEEINAAVDLRQQLAKALLDRDEARAVLSNLSHYLSCGLGDDNTGAQEYAARIREGINFLLTPILEDNRKLVHALKEAWLAMDEVEGTDRINDWQNKNAHILNIDDKRKN